MKELLEAVLAAPDDDQPRLVYADALAAQGDPRGELIQVQCALKGNRGNHAALMARERQLLQEHRKKWDAQFDPLHLVWSRGFPDAAIGSTEELAQRLPACVAACPIRSITVSSNRRGSFKAFAALPALERIVELEISGSDRHDDWTVGDEGAQQLAASPHLRSLERLVIGPNGIGEGGAAALAQAPWLPQLKKLSIGKNTVDPRMFEALTGLRELSVMGTKVVADGLARCAPTLERLRLRDCGLGPAGAQALAGFAMPALAALLLDENMIRDDGAVALARARWPKLESLRLDHNGIGDAGAAALAEMKSPLIELNLSNNYIKAAGARALAESTVLTTLLRLNLESNQLGVEGVTALADGKGLPALNELGCAYNGIYTAEVEQWTDWDGSAVGEGKVAESYAALKARFAGKPHLKIP